MLNFNEVEKIHDLLVEKSGGAKGVRDKGLLESSIKNGLISADLDNGSLTHWPYLFAIAKAVAQVA